MAPELPKCKCCESSCAWLGAVDFSVSGRNLAEDPLPESGVPVDYYRCRQCGFMFTPFFDEWTEGRLKAEIYNDDYIRVDPDFVEKRPAATAALVERLFAKDKESIRILDFGGGEGRTIERLKEKGFTNAVSFDPFHDNAPPPPGKFDLILAFEVIEHVPEPFKVFQAIVPLLRDPGLFMFSTLLQPPDIEKIGTKWWYVMPRNGHVSFHTVKSLNLVARRSGLECGSLNENVHFALARIPAFASHILSKN